MESVNLESVTPGYVVPTADPAGNPLSARDQFRELMRNPSFVRDALTPHTPANALKRELDARMVAEVEPAAAGEIDPRQYRLPYPADWEPTPEAAQFDTQARGWLAAAGLDANTGSSLALQLVQQAEYWRAHPDQWDTSADEGRKVLEGIFGKEADAVIKTADGFVRKIEAKAPGLQRWLADNNLANDPHIITRFYWLARAQG
jgi:hypothetical protein